MNNKDKNFIVKLFVYGTLKKGFSNHTKKFCKGLLNIEKASIQGRIFNLHEGYPAMEIPQENILFIGSSNYLKDSKIQKNAEEQIRSYKIINGDWDTIQGEMLTYKNPHIILPLIDELEEFYPNKKSTYQRVLIYTKSLGKIFVAWTYRYILKHNGERIYNGNWSEKT